MENAVADALSRIEMNALLDASQPQIDLVAMAKAQQQHTDPELFQILSFPSSYSLILSNIPLSFADGTIICDTSTGVQRPLYQHSFAVMYLTPYTHCPTPEYVQLNILL